MTNKILFAGAGFTIQLNVVFREEVFKVPGINDFEAYNQGLLNCQAKNLKDFISKKFGSEMKPSWEKVVEEIGEMADPDVKRRLLKQAYAVYGDTVGLNYGISPTCPVTDKRNSQFKNVMTVINDFFRKERFKAIITTNHDLTLDHWLLSGREDYKDLVHENPSLFGFPISESHWIESPDNFIEDNYSYKDISKSTWEDGEFRFLKLHGSINWWKSDDGFPYITERIPQWKDGKSIRDYMPGRLQEYLMGPDVKKEIEYGREPYKSILNEARRLIQSADVVVVYGFGYGEADRGLLGKLFGEAKVRLIDVNKQCQKHGQDVRKKLPCTIKDIQFMSPLDGKLFYQR